MHIVFIGFLKNKKSIRRSITITFLLNFTQQILKKTFYTCLYQIIKNIKHQIVLLVICLTNSLVFNDIRE